MTKHNSGTREERLAARPELRAADGTALGAADWLCLAAAPTFATMALLTGLLGGGRPDLLCSAAQDASPLSGMVPMYLLMSAFHSTPWLKLISRRRRGAHAPESRHTCNSHHSIPGA
jgi:hypothetical protein